MRRAGLVSVALLGLLACGRSAPPIVPIGTATEMGQRSLLAPDPHQEARRALQERLAVRERRFREAYAPGSVWSVLRVEQHDIDAGRVPGAELLDIGKELFAIDFTPAQGLGNGLARLASPLAGPRPAPNLRHVHYKEFGGPDATRCLACHHTGGDGGGGFRSDNVFFDGDGQTPASALERNPRALPGAALLQLLAEEMSAELQEQVARARRQQGPDPVRVPLSAKGVSFGTLRISRGGLLLLGGVRGVGPDLRVRPFGWKGTVTTIREAVERSLQQNLGIQAEGYGHRRSYLLGDGPDPADPDGDGVTREATAGMVSAMSAYIAALAPPIEEMPEDASFRMRATQGAAVFQKVGCAGCHVPELPLRGTVIGLGPRPGDEPRFDLAPLLSSPAAGGRARTVRLYSDLKRHDMGDELAEPRAYRGVARQLWLTPPLWGVAASAPYLHDGRAATLDAAILAHGGEAAESRDAYQKLIGGDQGRLHIFLMALDRPHHLEFRR